MVEYAVLVAHTSINIIAGDVRSWFSRLDTGALAYVVLALVTLRIAAWAFKPTR
jgi:hypothetical protein